jgi:hypothetical protein
MALTIEQLILAVIIGTLAAIVYSLRILVLMERRVAKMEFHVEKIVEKVLSEEVSLERSFKKKK